MSKGLTKKKEKEKTIKIKISSCAGNLERRPERASEERKSVWKVGEERRGESRPVFSFRSITGEQEQGTTGPGPCLWLSEGEGDTYLL